MTALRSRPFPHRLVVVTMDPGWTAVDAAATHPVNAGEVFRGFIRLGSGDDARYGYELREVAIANDPRLFTELRAGYSR